MIIDIMIDNNDNDKSLGIPHFRRVENRKVSDECLEECAVLHFL